METKPFFIVSDIHLGAVPRSTEQAFRRFLAHAGRSASGLLINGDLFDFWFEYRSVVPHRHFRVLADLADLVDAGLPIAFIGGNHDAWGGAFLRDEVGMEVLEGPVVRSVGDRTTLIAHGDGVGTGDLGYRILRRTIRHPFTVGAFRRLHPDWGDRIAALVSTTEHKADSGDRASRGRARHIEEWAEEQLRARPEVELVLAGHSHVPVVTEVESGRYYANSGDWIRHFTYLELPPEPGPPQLRKWSE